jgi:hypothetical protein
MKNFLIANARLTGHFVSIMGPSIVVYVRELVSGFPITGGMPFAHSTLA